MQSAEYTNYINDIDNKLRELKEVVNTSDQIPSNTNLTEDYITKATSVKNKLKDYQKRSKTLKSDRDDKQLITLDLEITKDYFEMKDSLNSINKQKLKQEIEQLKSQNTALMQEHNRMVADISRLLYDTEEPALQNFLENIDSKTYDVELPLEQGDRELTLDEEKRLATELGLD
jgi:hypothetical protein